MGVRGQNNEAWLSRWRDGACPVHGKGFVVEGAEGEFKRVRCTVEECDVRAAQWPGDDDEHASFGFIAGPENIKALLVKAGDVDADSPKPGKRARTVRIAYRLE